MKYTDLIGYAATIVASSSLVPQVVKVWRTKRAEDVSYGMIFMIMLASALWHAHGWINNDTPLRVSSGVTMCVNMTLALLKYKYDSAMTKTTTYNV